MNLACVCRNHDHLPLCQKCRIGMQPCTLGQRDLYLTSFWVAKLFSRALMGPAIKFDDYVPHGVERILVVVVYEILATLKVACRLASKTFMPAEYEHADEDTGCKLGSWASFLLGRHRCNWAALTTQSILPNPTLSLALLLAPHSLPGASSGTQNPNENGLIMSSCHHDKHDNLGRKPLSITNSTVEHYDVRMQVPMSPTHRNRQLDSNEEPTSVGRGSRLPARVTLKVHLSNPHQCT